MRRIPIRHQSRFGTSRAAAYAIAIIVLSCFVADAVSAAPLRALDFPPVDVSADGSVVTGWGVVWNSATGTKTGIGLPPSRQGPGVYTEVRSISADGSTVVGGARDLFWDFVYGAEAFRWTAATGTVALGTQTDSTEATGVSADGSVVVGNAGDLNGTSSLAAFRWSADTGMLPLPDMHFASAVSDDGKTVVGNWSSSRGGWVTSATGAVRWTAEEATIRLGALPGHNRSAAADVSADGSVVVGVSQRFMDETFDTHLFRWTAAGGMTDLGLLATVPWTPDFAISMSADGTVIVGHRLQGTEEEPFVWDEAQGIRALGDALTGLGVDLGGWDLERISGISGDGRTFIGYGLDPSGNRSGWIVTVPEPAGLTLLVSASAGLLGVRRRGR